MLTTTTTTTTAIKLMQVHAFWDTVWTLELGVEYRLFLLLLFDVLLLLGFFLIFYFLLC